MRLAERRPQLEQIGSLRHRRLLIARSRLLRQRSEVAALEWRLAECRRWLSALDDHVAALCQSFDGALAAATPQRADSLQRRLQAIEAARLARLPVLAAVEEAGAAVQQARVLAAALRREVLQLEERDRQLQGLIERARREALRQESIREEAGFDDRQRRATTG